MSLKEVKLPRMTSTSSNIPLIEVQYKKNYELKIEDLQLEKLRGI